MTAPGAYLLTQRAAREQEIVDLRRQLARRDEAIRLWRDDVAGCIGTIRSLLGADEELLCTSVAIEAYERALAMMEERINE